MIAALAREFLGQDLMPHQQRIADVATEYDPKTGIPFYRKVVVTVPRQSGKTTLDLALTLDRLISTSAPRRAVYTAQTGKDARKKFLTEQVPMLRTSKGLWGARPTEKPRGDGLITNLRLRAGEEGIDFRNRSMLFIESSSESAGHGGSIHKATLDEIWADHDMARPQSLSPSMITVADAQLWMYSTAGNARSVLLNREQRRGRRAVEDGVDSGVAYFEWSAPAGSDIDDEELWWATMPALGYTQSIEAMRAERESFDDPEDEEGPDGFRRAYLNIPTVGAVSEIPMDKWDAVTSPNVAPSDPVVLALEVTIDRDAGSLAVADELGQIELLMNAAGTAWCLEATAKAATATGAPVFIDGGGPAAVFIDPLTERGVNVVSVKLDEFAAACGGLFDAVVNRTISVRDSPRLDEAIAAATKRKVGQRWTWARQVGAYDATPLTAICLALWGTAHRPSAIDWDDDPIVFVS